MKSSEGLLMKYFVLSPRKRGPYGGASRAAIMAYSKAIRKENPIFADELVAYAFECYEHIAKICDDEEADD